MTLACVLAISMGLDVSYSVNRAEKQMMFEGLAAALASEEVAEGLAETDAVLHVFVWSNVNDQRVILPATRIETVQDAMDAAALVASESAGGVYHTTATGNAMLFGVAELARTGCSDQRLNIISDGENNRGPEPRTVRDGLDDWRLQINGVAIGNGSEFLTTNVIYGPGAFVEASEDFGASLIDAFKRKLGREIHLSSIP